MLKNIPFELPGRESLLTIVRYCNDKIGLNLGYSINIHAWQETMPDNCSPLQNTFEDTAKYIGLACYEVLENIMALFDATICQGSPDAEADGTLKDMTINRGSPLDNSDKLGRI